jgi:PAS domain S-box-containing protein
VTKSIRILILEDDSTDAELVKRQLRKGKITFSSKVVATRADFVRGLDTFAPDLILSDGKLPGFDGLSALAIAREKRPSAPFIFFSGTLDEERGVESLRQGATDYILKDRRARLAPAVRRALRDAEERSRRERMAEALRESEARFRLLVEGVRDYAICLLDPEGRVTSWNTGARRLFGYDSKEIIGQPLSRFYSHEENQRHTPEQTVRAAIEHGRVEEETWRVRKDGSRFWANVIATAVRDGSGKLQGLACITRDMSQRMQAEESVRRIQERQSSLLRSAPITLYTAALPPDRGKTWVSENVQRLTGYSPEEMVRDRTFWIERLDPDDRERVLKDFESILHRRAITTEYRWRYADGTYRWLLDEAVLACDEKGNPKEIIGSCLDITERRQREAELSETAELYRTIARNIPGGAVAVFDRDLRYVLVDGSQTLEEMGLRKEEVEGKTIFELFPPELYAELEPVHRAALAGEPTLAEMPYRHHMYLVHAFPLKHGQGEIYGGIALILDITERRLVEDRVRRLNEELERRVAERTEQVEAVNQELQAFSYTVSHDLRAPLRAVQGLANAMLEDYAGQLDSAGKDFARRIVAAANRMDKLIQGLLEYSRLSRLQLELESIDLASVVASVLSQLEAELRERNAQVTVEGTLPAVRGHPLTLEQVLSNLISNAVKFVAPDVAPNVRIRAQPRGSRVRLWVEDNGIGIAPEHHGRIFNVFERLHGIETFPGTGVGLAIVRKGAERMGGRVGLESEPGRGSKFWLELPEGSRTS